MSYKVGYRFEWRVKQTFAEKGFIVRRNPASKPYDLDVIENGRIKYLIECKTTSKDQLYVYGLKKIIETAKKFKAKPLLVYAFYYTPMYVKEIKKEGEKAFKNKKNILLEKYLGG